MRSLTNREILFIAVTASFSLGCGFVLLVDQRIERIQQRTEDHLKARIISGNANYTVKALYSVRSGNTNATIKELEFLLKDDLWKLGWYSEHLPELKQDRHYCEDLRLIRDYRVKFPPTFILESDRKIEAGAFQVLD